MTGPAGSHHRDCWIKETFLSAQYQRCHKHNPRPPAWRLDLRSKCMHSTCILLLHGEQQGPAIPLDECAVVVRHAAAVPSPALPGALLAARRLAENSLQAAPVLGQLVGNNALVVRTHTLQHRSRQAADAAKRHLQSSAWATCQQSLVQHDKTTCIPCCDVQEYNGKPLSDALYRRLTALVEISHRQLTIASHPRTCAWPGSSCNCCSGAEARQHWRQRSP